MSVREDLKAFIDGELPPGRMAEVRAAVDADPVLQSEVEYMKALGDGIRLLSEEPEIVGMERVLGAVKGRSARAPWWAVRPIWAATAACVLFIAVSAALIKPLTQYAEYDVAAAPEKGAAGGDAFKEDLRGYSNSDAPGMEKSKPSTSVGGRAAAMAADGTSMELGKSQSEAPEAARDIEKKSAYGELRATAPSNARQAEKPADSGALADVPSRAKGFDGPAWADDTANGVKTRPVRAASIVVHVENLAEAERQATRVAAMEGGFAQIDPAVPPDGDKKQVVICVPGANFESALKTVRSIGTVVSEDHRLTNSPDERRNLSSQLSTLRGQLGAWVRRLSRKPKPETVVAQSQVKVLNRQIQNLSERQKALESDPTFSNIVAIIERKPADLNYGSPPPKKLQESTSPADAPSGLPVAPTLIAIGVALLAGLAWWFLRRR